MEVLGQRPNSVVVVNPQGQVEKFYKLEAQWEQEGSNLRFLADAQTEGLDIGCTIPRLIGSQSSASLSVGDQTYEYSNTMGRIDGTPSNQDSVLDDPQRWASTLGRVVFNLHAGSRPYIPDWTASFGEEDMLLSHILKDKAAGVLQGDSDRSVRQHVEQASQYLEEQVPLRAIQLTLSHQDLNPSNVLVNERGDVEGLVDWVTLGLTHPTLSLYQLVARPKIWKPFKEEYLKLGGKIEDDILYAASLIHLAWANLVWYPQISKGLGIAMDKDETLERFEEMHANFRQAARAL